MTSGSAKTLRRRNRVRFKIKQKSSRVRLSVFRSNRHIYAQLIDDKSGKTIAAASSGDKEIVSKLKSTSNIEAAGKVGELIASKAKKAKVAEVVFDKGSYLYHGRVKELAEKARAGGLSF